MDDCGMARTNYFRVKDKDRFREWAEELELVAIGDDQGRLGLYSETSDGGFPSQRSSEDGDEMQDLDFAAELATHGGHYFFKIECNE